MPGSSVIRLDSSGLGITKLSVKSQENIDADTIIATHLEGGFSVDTGAAGNPNQFFDRMMNVSLQNKSVKMTLGKQFSPHLLQLGGEYDVFATSFWGTPYAIFQGASRYILIPNALSLEASTLPENKLKLSAMWANRQDKAASKPPGNQLFLSAFYEIRQDLHVGISTVNDHHFSLTNPHATLTLLGFNYNTGKFRLSGGMQTIALKEKGSRINEFCLGGGYDLNPANQIQVSYAKTYEPGAAQKYAHVIGVAYVHHLSKRTALYASIGRIANGADYAYAFDVAAANGEATDNIMMGIRHNF